MKRIVCIVLLLCLVGGCAIDDDAILYRSYIEELQEVSKSSEDSQDVHISYQLDRDSAYEITYSVVIDEPSKAMYHVEALVYHDQKTEDIFPSIGIFDTKVNLLPNLKKNKENNVKGIVLVGYIKTKKQVEHFHPTFKVILLYHDANGEKHKIYDVKKM